MEEILSIVLAVAAAFACGILLKKKFANCTP
jgi:hypothetical protein